MQPASPINCLSTDMARKYVSTPEHRAVIDGTMPVWPWERNSTPRCVFPFLLLFSVICSCQILASAHCANNTPGEFLNQYKQESDLTLLEVPSAISSSIVVSTHPSPRLEPTKVATTSPKKRRHITADLSWCPRIAGSMSCPSPSHNVCCCGVRHAGYRIMESQQRRCRQ